MGCASSEAAAVRSDVAGVGTEAAGLRSQAIATGTRTVGALKPTDVGIANIKGQVVSRLLNTETAKSMSRNALAGVLTKYPEAKEVFNVPQTTNIDTAADTAAVKAAGDNLLSHYTDIAKSTDSDLNSTIQKKAEELNKQGVKAEYVKAYGDNLAQNAIKDAGNKLSTEEENAWKTASNEITSKLTAAMNKLPKPAST